jgi:hypothetical protein
VDCLARHMKKRIPTFKSDRAAEAFVEKADLSQYDLSGAQLVRFEIKRKEEEKPTAAVIRKPLGGGQRA